MSKFHKSAIITGDLNCFCLVCEIHLKSERDANTHMSDSSHQINLESSTYLQKFKNNNIRKVKTGYYCEFCNVLLSTIAKTNLHVTDPSHIKKRRELTFNYYGNDVVASNNILVTAKAWNGFIENMCAACNSEFDDEEVHKNETTHVLNLIKRPVEFGADGFMYRLVDEISYHCLTCNAIFALNSLSSHHDNEDHKKSYNERYVPEHFQPTYVAIEEIARIHARNEESSKHKIFEQLPEIQKKGIKINFETETAFCTKCSLNVDMNFTAIKTHIDNHTGLPKTIIESQEKIGKIHLSGEENLDINHNETSAKTKENLTETSIRAENLTATEFKKPQEEQIDANIEARAKKQSIDLESSKDRENVKILASAKDLEQPEATVNNIMNQELENSIAFAKANNLTYDKHINSVYCCICNTKIPKPLNCMEEHVAGANHKRNRKILENKMSENRTEKKREKTEKKREKTEKKNEKTEKKKNYVPKKELKKFINLYTRTRGLFFNDIILDENYCIEFISFHMITNIALFLFRCQICEINITGAEIEEHVDSPYHDTTIEETLVVTNLEGEFVREVRSGLYHCGFCNLIVGDWDQLQLHLLCQDHRNNRCIDNLRLARHLPKIREHRRQEFSRMLFGFFTR